MVAICLGRRLPTASSDQPEDRPGTFGPPIWSCSGWGLPSRPVTRPLVRSYRTISPLLGAAHPPEADVQSRAVWFLWHSP
jgi:hypothetical protein